MLINKHERIVVPIGIIYRMPSLIPCLLTPCHPNPMHKCSFSEHKQAWQQAFVGIGSYKALALYLGAFSLC